MSHGVLHIANHSATVQLIKEAGIAGETLAWQDPLYQGPVLALPMDELSEVRADYFSRQGWGRSDRILALYQSRNAQLRDFRQYDEVVLWFDHDLQDQLQLIQLLNWFSQQTMANTRLSLITIDRYPGIYRFTGLEILQPGQLQPLLSKKVEVSISQFELARMAWEVVTATDPIHLQAFSWPDMSSLPFLKDALSRLQEEYPGNQDGLSRTERQILQAVYSGFSSPKTVYEIAQRKEDRPFLSEKAFRFCLKKLLLDQQACLAVKNAEPVENIDADEFFKQQVYITTLGFKTLAEERDFVFLNGIDRWVGGVHLSEANIWRRNSRNKTIKRTYA